MRTFLLAVFSSALAAPSFGQFSRIEPGPDQGTGCGRGADFAFFFRPGTSNNLVVDFEGGGGCWDVLTCALPTWSTTVGNSPPSANGLVSTTNANNPVRDWNYLFIPYCTGDVHLGAREAAGVNFNGRANAQAALDYAYERVPSPGTVLTTGCSAGALGAVAWAGHIAMHYREARHVQFGDSYIGVTTASHWATLDSNWDLLTSFYNEAPGLSVERLRQYSDDICPYIVAQVPHGAHHSHSV
jgi:hypothetical protein